MNSPLVERFDWSASADLLESEIASSALSRWGDALLVAWHRSLKYYYLHLDLSLADFDEERSRCLALVEKMLKNLEVEGAKRRQIRSLSLIGPSRSVAQLTRLTSRGSSRVKHGRVPLLQPFEVNVVLRCADCGLSTRAMARTLAMGVRPVSDSEFDRIAWIDEVRRRVRPVGRPAAADRATLELTPIGELRRYERVIERHLEASRFMEVVTAAGSQLQKHWPVRN